VPAIPRIIHQTWKSHDIPHDIYPEHWIESWKTFHPHWEHRLWTDADAEELVRKTYPQFYDFYVALEPPIKKADFARFLFLHSHGGVYVDLDMVCLQPVAPLLAEHELVFGRLSPDNDYYQVPNAFMASTRYHDFWMRIAYDAMRAPPGEQAVETLAGPFRLEWALARHRPRCHVHGDGIIYPFDWIHLRPWRERAPRADVVALATKLRMATVDEMARALPGAYCVTFWAHNW